MTKFDLCRLRNLPEKESWSASSTWTESHFFPHRIRCISRLQSGAYRDRHADRQRGESISGEILKQWLARQKVGAEFFSDFSELCASHFVGLSLEAAQEKLIGAGQQGSFVFISPGVPPAPPGMVTAGGGFGIHSSIISGTAFNIGLFVDAHGTPTSRKVRAVAGCGVRDVAL